MISFSFSTGSSIGIFTAHDLDEKNTVNSILKYKIVVQAPQIPIDGLFLVEEYEGKFQLARQSLKKQDSPQYNLTVQVSDKGQYGACCHKHK
jgi:cadherin 17 (LI cadherin)